MKISALNRKLHRAFGGRVTAALADGCIVLRGELDRWDDVVRAGQMAATKYSTCHVVNDITLGKYPVSWKAYRSFLQWIIISRRICGKICVHWYSRPNMNC